MPTHKEYLAMSINEILHLIEDELYPAQEYALPRLTLEDLRRMHTMTGHYAAKCVHEMMTDEGCTPEQIRVCTMQMTPGDPDYQVVS